MKTKKKAAKTATKRKWMAKAFSKHPGKLHQRLHVPEGEPIPESKLEKATHSSDTGLNARLFLPKRQSAMPAVATRKRPSSAREDGSHARACTDRSRRILRLFAG